MDSNAFLTRFGFDPEEFEAGAEGPIRSDEGFVYEATELRREDAECPFCRSIANVEVHGHYLSTVRCNGSEGATDTLRARRIVYRCRRCGRTFTLDLKGIAHNEMGLTLSNGRMECMNNRIKTIIKDAYGYRSFERFRERALLILWADLGR